MASWLVKTTPSAPASHRGAAVPDRRAAALCQGSDRFHYRPNALRVAATDPAIAWRLSLAGGFRSLGWMIVARNLLLLVLGIALLQVIIWVPVIRWMRKRSAAAEAALEAEISASGERVVRGPEQGEYRGASGGYSQVKGNCRLVLTDRRLAFVKLTGGRVDVPVDQIVGVREEKAFLGSVVGGRTHVIVKTRDGSEVGFFAKDQTAWVSALRPTTTA